MAAAPSTFLSRKLDPEVLAARAAPFAGALLVAFSFFNLQHDGTVPSPTLFAVALGALIVVAAGAVPWRSLPTWAQTLPPLAFFVLVAVLVDVDGGSGSSFAPLALLPVVWLALFGNRVQLLAGILGAVAVFLVPIVWLGAPRYPPSQWQTPTMWMVTVAVIGTIVHELVREMGARSARIDGVASSDELTSLPSRSAWAERLPQELDRARREAWQVSVALFVLDGLDELRKEQGDAAADTMLRETAFSWSQQLRGTDLLARYDDRAFAAAFPGCSLGGAVQIAESLRSRADVPVSVGVACWDGVENDTELAARAAGAVADARGMGGAMVVAASTT
jgi:diguanylate cyclase (GGDEF)-like protein